MLQEELPWKQLYEMAVVCCRHRKLRGFSEQLLGELEKLIPFDEAMILYLDGNQKLTDYYLYHIDPKWAYLYVLYYSKAEQGMYGYSGEKLDITKDVIIHVWENEESAEVIPDYIRPQKLVSSMAFYLRDQSGCIRTIFSLDRLSKKHFTQQEAELVREAKLLLELHHQMLYTAGTEDGLDSMELECLTGREMEVVKLLQQGLSPASISHVLHIAPSTTNRHISNIYKKINVNSRVELMIKIRKKN